MTIPEITKRYIGDKSIEEFAGTLGINTSRQLVWFWKEGTRTPSLDTLFRVRNSPHATDEAKAWASECLAAKGIHGVENLELTFDQEVERRR